MDSIWAGLQELRKTDPRVHACLVSAAAAGMVDEALDDQDTDEDEDDDEGEDEDDQILADELDEVAEEDEPVAPVKSRLEVVAEAAAAAAAVPQLSMPQAKYAARRAAVRTLLKLHRHLSNAIGCMLCSSLDTGELPDNLEAGDTHQHTHEALIAMYEKEIRATPPPFFSGPTDMMICTAILVVRLCAAGRVLTVRGAQAGAFHAVLVDEWRPEKVGLVLSQTGRTLVNWPLHVMSEHVPAQMRYLKEVCNLIFGWTTTQITERINTLLKSHLVDTRRRTIGVDTDTVRSPQPPNPKTVVLVHRTLLVLTFVVSFNLLVLHF